MVEKIYNTAAIKSADMMRALLLAFLVVLGGCGANSGNIPVTPQLLSIAITPSSLNIAPGATQQLTATGTYSNGSTADITASVVWTPNTPVVATINSTGLATGLASGWSSFTASLGSVSGSMTVPTLVSIAITPASLSLAPGATQQLTATGTYSNGSTVDITASVTWTPNTPLIATVNSTGLATGLAAGWSRFTAALGGVAGSTVVPLFAEVEPNNTLATANHLTSMATLTGQLSSQTDLDFYQLTASGAGNISVVFACNAMPPPTSSGGWQFSILNQAGDLLSSKEALITVYINSTATSTCPKTLTAAIAAAGTYYVLVQSAAWSLTENYTLTATVP